MPEFLIFVNLKCRKLYKPKSKICCIKDTDEAFLAINAGADAIGLVGKMPSGPGPIDDVEINRIAKAMPENIMTFLLTSETTAKGIAEHHKRVNTNTIQIVDAITKDTYDELRELLPEIRLVQVIHIRDDKSIDEAVRISEKTDMLLLDSGNPALKIKELGGTGRVHDWNISRIICEAVNKPVFLAGGLNPENIREAIETVQPYGVDVCSGLRSNGRLDKNKLKKYFEEINKK
jgi:phosphoribosylanthranilate isomerase